MKGLQLDEDTEEDEGVTELLLPPPALEDEGTTELLLPPPELEDEGATELLPPPPELEDEGATELLMPPPLEDEMMADDSGGVLDELPTTPEEEDWSTMGSVPLLSPPQETKCVKAHSTSKCITLVVISPP